VSLLHDQLVGSASNLFAPSGIGTTALLQKIWIPPVQSKFSISPPLMDTVSGLPSSRMVMCMIRLPQLLQKKHRFFRPLSHGQS
jgi:hypothetical protein